MSWFKGLQLIVKKELKDYFTTPLVCILTAIFSLTVGWLFFNYLVAAKQLTQQTLSQAVLLPIFGNMNFIFLFLAPLITMRSISEERKLHTIEILFLSDLSEWQIVIGKFLSSFGVVLFMLLTTMIFPIILTLSGYSDWGIVFTSYLGILFSVACYLSVGIFASSLTENQIISALLSFGLLLGMMLLVLTAQVIDNQIVSQIIKYISITSHYEYFVHGSLVSFSFIFFLSFIGFFHYLTTISLKSRTW